MSKSKGNKFELMVFKDLRQYNPILKRTIGSGSSEDDADLVDDRFIIECKHHRELTQSQLNKFWKKLIEEAYKQKKTPVLVYKENNKPIKVITWAIPYGNLHPEVDYVMVTIDYEIWKKVCYVPSMESKDG